MRHLGAPHTLHGQHCTPVGSTWLSLWRHGMEPSTSYRLLPVRLQGPGPATVRYLYIKPHASGQDSLPKDRAVYVTGVPAALQGTALVELFAKFGEVERAALHGSRVSAVLLYAAAEGRDKLLKAAAKGRPVELKLQEPAGPCGLKGEEGSTSAEVEASLGHQVIPWQGQKVLAGDGLLQD